MNQELAFLVVNTLIGLVGVLILALLWVASRLPTATKERPLKADAQPTQTAKLLDASVTRRWMRYSATEESEGEK